MCVSSLIVLNNLAVAAINTFAFIINKKQTKSNLIVFVLQRIRKTHVREAFAQQSYQWQWPPISRKSLIRNDSEKCHTFKEMDTNALR